MPKDEKQRVVGRQYKHQKLLRFVRNDSKLGIAQIAKIEVAGNTKTVGEKMPNNL